MHYFLSSSFLSLFGRGYETSTRTPVSGTVSKLASEPFWFYPSLRTCCRLCRCSRLLCGLTAPDLQTAIFPRHPGFQTLLEASQDAPFQSTLPPRPASTPASPLRTSHAHRQATHQTCTLRRALHYFSTEGSFPRRPAQLPPSLP